MTSSRKLRLAISLSLLVCMSFMGLGAVWAGGTSSLLDRTLRQGHVTDFIFISVGTFHTGVFIAADLTIVIGIAAIGLSLWNRRHGPPSAKAR